MSTTEVEYAPPPEVSFSHLHIYAETLESLSTYKEIESRLNAFHSAAGAPAFGATPADCSAGKALFSATPGAPIGQESKYVSQDRDVVRQLLAGLGYRVTGIYDGANTLSMLVTSKDPKGVQICVTAPKPNADKTVTDQYLHFDASSMDRFLAAHNGHPGIAVLAFEVTSGNIETIRTNYEVKHPALLPPNALTTYRDGAGTTTQVLEVFAYYKGEVKVTDADQGTLLRFVSRQESHASAASTCKLPGLVPVTAAYDQHTMPAYCDHWVSNVVSRTGFLDTLEDTLGFTPKVDFNAGVVAAGEAQIESTVTGNTSKADVNFSSALKDQSQVYLPINNALSPVGHVYGFIEEIGQGIQHVASRVSDLIAFIQAANDRREVTGEGFTFLNIPRSYYGVLTERLLIDKGSSEGDAGTVFDACIAAGICNETGEVDLSLCKDDISDKLKGTPQVNGEVVDVIAFSRYCNLYTLLRHHLTEQSYIAIVRNKILVDVQGEDLLFQIFTASILQKNVGDEAPFFEFIQRVCSECLGPDGCPAKIKPGCGGFGIRNFLTLFLSIEVSKAMTAARDAKVAGDDKKLSLANRQVSTFTDQLNEANPILTDISDAMTAEGKWVEALEAGSGDTGEVTKKIEEFKAMKEAGNQRLMVCSTKYKNIMKALREEA